MGTLSDFPNSDVRMMGRRFEDADEAAEVLSIHREIEIKPISLDPFHADVCQVDFGDDLTIVLVEALSPVYITGDRRTGFVHFASFLELGSQTTYVHQHPVDLHPCSTALRVCLE